jgi:DNA segregation ATPase FtsK/SpoIIIE, S-DNA-T family
MHTMLQFQADRIELLLAQHRLLARVTGGTVTPRTVRFQLLPGPGLRLRRITELAEERAQSLGVAQCRVFREQGCLQVEVPREERTTVDLAGLCAELADVPPCTPLLGLDHNGCPLLLNLPSPEVSHALIAGTTGSGKTELARVMIASLVRFNRQAQLQLLLIDPKNRGFAPFRGLPHLLQPIVTECEAALEALRAVVDEMIRRDQEGRSSPRIVIFIDELADLALVSPKELQTLLTRLAQRGREAGIHLIACTQKPSADIVGSLVKANFPVRLVGSVTTPEDAKVATGLARTGAEKLLGRGDFLAVARGETTRFQAAYVAESEIRTFVGLAEGGGLTRSILSFNPARCLKRASH